MVHGAVHIVAGRASGVVGVAVVAALEHDRDGRARHVEELGIVGHVALNATRIYLERRGHTPALGVVGDTHKLGGRGHTPALVVGGAGLHAPVEGDLGVAVVGGPRLRPRHRPRAAPAKAVGVWVLRPLCVRTTLPIRSEE